jgi:hypothetical protein
MGSFDRLKACVLPHVPKERLDTTTSALQALTDLCRWIDKGGMPVVPEVDMDTLCTAVNGIFGTVGVEYCINSLMSLAEEYTAYDRQAATDRLYRAMPRFSVSRDLADALPWSLSGVLWEPTRQRVAEFGVQHDLQTLPHREAAARMMQEFTHHYVMAVLGDDVKTIAQLKPIVTALPFVVFVGPLPGKVPAPVFFRF